MSGYPDLPPEGDLSHDLYAQAIIKCSVTYADLPSLGEDFSICSTYRPKRVKLSHLPEAYHPARDWPGDIWCLLATFVAPSTSSRIPTPSTLAPFPFSHGYGECVFNLWYFATYVTTVPFYPPLLSPPPPDVSSYYHPTHYLPGGYYHERDPELFTGPYADLDFGRDYKPCHRRYLQTVTVPLGYENLSIPPFLNAQTDECWASPCPYAGSIEGYTQLLTDWHSHPSFTVPPLSGSRLELMLGTRSPQFYLLLLPGEMSLPGYIPPHIDYCNPNSLVEGGPRSLQYRVHIGHSLVRFARADISPLQTLNFVIFVGDPYNVYDGRTRMLNVDGETNLICQRFRCASYKSDMSVFHSAGCRRGYYGWDTCPFALSCSGSEKITRSSTHIVRDCSCPLCLIWYSR